jgi:hypothetical protein
LCAAEVWRRFFHGAAMTMRQSAKRAAEVDRICHILRTGRRLDLDPNYIAAMLEAQQATIERLEQLLQTAKLKRLTHATDAA